MFVCVKNNQFAFVLVFGNIHTTLYIHMYVCMSLYVCGNVNRYPECLASFLTSVSRQYRTFNNLLQMEKKTTNIISVVI